MIKDQQNVQKQGNTTYRLPSKYFLGQIIYVQIKSSLFQKHAVLDELKTKGTQVALYGTQSKKKNLKGSTSPK